jgi:transmembrane sensor
MSSLTAGNQSLEQEASELFVQRLQGKWSASHQAELYARLARDPAFAQAFSRAERSWAALEAHAEAPEIMRWREEALAYARRASARRWSAASVGKRWRPAASIGAVAIALGIAWQFSLYRQDSREYRTGLGEQRVLDFEDHSRIALDSGTRVRVLYSKDARIVELAQGQAQFNVAHDPARPFKVIAGDRTIVAVGTVFTVDYEDREVNVAMLEGRVAVVDESAKSPPEARGVPGSQSSENPGRTIELSAGEELRVSRQGRATVVPHADLEAVTAWRQGKVIFRSEPLGDAIRRINRYSHTKIEIQDPALAGNRISGVFEAGDTQGFLDAVQRYLPVTTDSTEPGKVELRSR